MGGLRQINARFLLFFCLMENLDAVQINFSPDQLLFLNLCLAFLMFGVALDIQVKDFKLIFQKPRIPIIGLIAQLLLLPILTLILIYAFQPPPSLALGMVLISVCPGGNVSNFMVHLAKANAALSVMMTSIVTLGAAFLTPLNFAFWSLFVPNSASYRQIIAVDPVAMFITIFQLIVIPLALGMYLNKRYPATTDLLRRPVKILSILIFFGFVVAAMISNYENILKYVGVVFFIVLIHNTLALALGYYFSRLNGLDTFNARAIAIETGIQNSGLALILIFNFFNGLGGMAMIAAWWGIWHLISGFSLAMWWSRQADKQWSGRKPATGGISK